ncbi:hypothetical protein [Desulfotalea psychrophila]|uniref:Conjugal transfer protein TraM n=1 Tax=Desulfotalea psychrophila (strain LSv54 / DSM 12343) TaxID=177439 RepID=Q6AIH2_DESPS|nr:hypothetical protein [Desulfotalea psychrophila]CAG37875.1 hypothetical protein DPPB11 [Desulfotalea psychrophila LSv54]
MATAKESTEVENLQEDEFKALSKEKARKIIAEQNNLTLSEDDPILALVTLHGAFIEDHKELLKGEIETIKTALRSTISESLEHIQIDSKKKEASSEATKKYDLNNILTSSAISFTFGLFLTLLIMK